MSGKWLQNFVTDMTMLVKVLIEKQLYRYKALYTGTAYFALLDHFYTSASTFIPVSFSLH